MPEPMPRSLLPVVVLSLGVACNSTSPKPAAKADSAAKTDPAAKPDPAAKTDPAEADPAESDPDAKPGSRTWTFDDAAAGEVPAGIRLAETGGQGTPATWAVVADPTAPTGPNAFGITESKNDKRTYNVAFVEGTEVADVDLSVMVRSVSGNLNRGGGPIWRVVDPDNYYIARWDPVENNAYFYVMQGGVRTALAKTDLEIPGDAWHSLRVVMEGTHMELLIDDEPVLEVDDSSLTKPGMIGLWTKSDAATLFDDLSVAAP